MQQLEAAIDTALKDSKAVQAGVTKLKKAAAAGELRNIDRSLSGILSSVADLSKSVEALQGPWTFPSEPYFSEGGFQAEFLEASAAAGLQMFERDGRIYCYPMLLSISPRDLALMADRKPERRVRPRALVRILAERQKAPQRFPVGQFLETVWSAYNLIVSRPDHTLGAGGVERGPVVPLVDVHAALTLRPGSAREYPLPEFSRDIHLLDQHPDLATREGWRFTLPAATATKGGRRLMVVDRDGRERVYVGIAFHRE